MYLPFPKINFPNQWSPKANPPSNDFHTINQSMDLKSFSVLSSMKWEAG